jgi:hypothetical protein
MAFGDPQPTDAPKGGSPKAAEGILTQIQGLLHQYIDLGEGTPLYSEAHSFLGQVEDGLDRLKGEQEASAPEPGGEHHPPPSSFRGATKAASDAMKADGTFAGHHGGSKASPEEQTQEDEEKKKKGSKAGQY